MTNNFEIGDLVLMTNRKNISVCAYFDFEKIRNKVLRVSRIGYESLYVTGEPEIEDYGFYSHRFEKVGHMDKIDCEFIYG